MSFSERSCLVRQWLCGCILRHRVFLNKKNIPGNNGLQGRVLGRSSRRSLFPQQQIFIFARGTTCSCLLFLSSQTDLQRWLCLLGVRNSEDHCWVRWLRLPEAPTQRGRRGVSTQTCGQQEHIPRVKQHRKTGPQSQQPPVLIRIRCRERVDGMCNPACGSWPFCWPDTTM